MRHVLPRNFVFCVQRYSLTLVLVLIVWIFFTYYAVFNIEKNPHEDEPPVISADSRKSRLQIRLRNLENLEKDVSESIEKYKSHLRGFKLNHTGGASGPPHGPHVTDQGLHPQPFASVLPILVFACNRPSVTRNLDDILRYRGSSEKFPLIVSQDCKNLSTREAIMKYKGSISHFLEQPDQSGFNLTPKEKRLEGYWRVARHYRWALNQVFRSLQYEAAIIVEDDLNLAPDFFDYMEATYPLLHADASLWCVSAWNDNGKAVNIEDNPGLLWRTDFFPGLGWMLERSTWLELEPNWPITFWDDWMRRPEQRRERSCIRPEISRTSTFGKIGVSKGQFFDKHLKYIELNRKPFSFKTADLSYLRKETYDRQFTAAVYGSPSINIDQLMRSDFPAGTRSLRLEYITRADFKLFTKRLGVMDDLKSGVGRMAYRGVVPVMFKGVRIYLAPRAGWTRYDLSWN